VNPLADHDDLERVAAQTGFAIERITYYTPVVGAFIENVLVRIAERAMTRRAARAIDARTRATGAPADPDAAVRTVRASAKARVRERGATFRTLRALSTLMRLDLWLFGRIRSGPFFALLRKFPAGRAQVR